MNRSMYSLETVWSGCESWHLIGWSVTMLTLVIANTHINRHRRLDTHKQHAQGTDIHTHTHTYYVCTDTQHSYKQSTHTHIQHKVEEQLLYIYTHTQFSHINKTRYFIIYYMKYRRDFKLLECMIA